MAERGRHRCTHRTAWRALPHDRLGLGPAELVGAVHVHVEAVRAVHRLGHGDGLGPVATSDIDIELNVLLGVVALLILVRNLASCKCDPTKRATRADVSAPDDGNAGINPNEVRQTQAADVKCESTRVGRRQVDVEVIGLLSPRENEAQLAQRRAQIAVQSLCPLACSTKCMP